MSKNDITGDEIKSKVVTENYQNNFDGIFRKSALCNLCGREIKKDHSTTKDGLAHSLCKAMTTPA